MSKSTKYILMSVGLLAIGTLVYFKLQKNNVEDNGIDPDENADANQMNEDDNTIGANQIVVGDTLYPSGSYVNVRDGANVNNGFINNIIQVVNTPNSIGVVDDILVSQGHTWYKINLSVPILSTGGTMITTNNYGFVRSDVVTKTI